MIHSSPRIIIVSLVVLVISGSMLLSQCSPKQKENISEKNLSDVQGYSGDKACQSCHAAEYADWKTSHHAMAMQMPGDSTMLGDFSGVSFTADGVTSRFFKKDDQYIIQTQGPDGQSHDYPVAYTFGFAPLQQYLVAFPDGKYQVPRVSWDTIQKKWFHQYAGQNIPANDWLHWTGNSQNWNTMCASCHSTNLQKKYDIGKDAYQTSFDVINVSCESCHGPGKKHIDYMATGDYKKNPIAGSYLALTKNSSKKTQLNSCSPCHARRSVIEDVQPVGEEIMQHYIPEIPSTEFFHPDGQTNNENYNYTAFLQSKMYRRGVVCTDCHQPHSAKLKLPGNQVCLQCHAKTYDDIQHTFHTAGTEATTCVSCHMPSAKYMGNDLRHDHIFRSPRPDLTAKFKTPNTCNQCHTDKSATWADQWVQKWYGPKRAYHFAEDLIPGSQLQDKSEGHLIKLISDTSVPDMIKATAVHYLGSITTEVSLKTILQALRYPDAQVRFRALQALSGFPASVWTADASEALQDPVRAVRIAAAELFTEVPAEQLPESKRVALQQARVEQEKYLMNQADFSVGNVMLGDHYYKKKNYTEAERFYLRSLQKDGNMNYVRLNLSSLYGYLGKKEQALKQLLEAEKQDQSNDRIYYNLGLLYYEMKQIPQADKAFGKAVVLKSQNPRLYYNYGLLLKEMNRKAEAEKVLLQGVALQPNASELYYALSFVYMETRRPDKARDVIIKLKILDPSNPQYQSVFRQFGL